MVDRLESRSAGRQLAAILAVLVVPTLLMGVFFFNSVRHDIKFIDREIKGVQLADQVFARLVSPKGESSLDELSRIETLEKDLGIVGDARFAAHVGSELAASNDAMAPEHQHADGSVAGYLNDIATTSGLILDSDAMTYHLVDMVIINLSHILIEAAELEHKLAKDRSVGPVPEYIRMLGNLDEGYERYEDAMVRAKLASTNPEIFEALERKTIIIEQEMASLERRVLEPVATNNAELAHAIVQELAAASADVYKPSLGLISERLFERRSGLYANMTYLLAIGGLAALTALGMAALMFVRTFKKLDDLETARSVAERMRGESERINVEVAHLNRSLADKMSRLEEAQGELIKKGRMEQLGQLTATIAHEIRNPLGAVRTSAFLIDRKVKGKGIGVEAQLERINKGVERCDSIITQLLDFSRTRHVEARPLNLDSWLEQVITEEAENLPPVVAVSCDLGLADIQVPFDASRLRRAIVNLMNNASEAMVGLGDDPAKYSTASPEITISTRPVEGGVELSVRDNGPGMQSDVLQKVREPLFTTKSFGTGLGVPAVEQIVIQHGGSLRISSSPGQGAKFTIFLPINRESMVAA